MAWGHGAWHAVGNYFGDQGHRCGPRDLRTPRSCTCNQAGLSGTCVFLPQPRGYVNMSRNDETFCVERGVRGSPWDLSIGGQRPIGRDMPGDSPPPSSLCCNVVRGCCQRGNDVSRTGNVDSLVDGRQGKVMQQGTNPGLPSLALRTFGDRARCRFDGQAPPSRGLGGGGGGLVGWHQHGLPGLRVPVGEALPNFGRRDLVVCVCRCTLSAAGQRIRGGGGEAGVWGQPAICGGGGGGGELGIPGVLSMRGGAT